MKVLFCYGTRPEWIKILPLINEFKKRNVEFKILNVKQHTTLLSGDFDYEIDVVQTQNKNRLDNILSSISNLSENIFDGITHVLVQGDTATALACALSAFNRSISVIHLEAGLRTYDLENPYPEESYRQMISRITSIHLCPTESNRLNLLDEKVSGKIYVVGNTVLDNLLSLRNEVEYNDEIFITMHRRENHSNLSEWFLELSRLAENNKNLKFYLPIHPNPNVMKHKDLLQFINVIDPIPYEEFIKKIATCRFLITDSGGIQEEANFLGKKVIVCRKVTERVESLGESSFLCRTPSELHQIFENINLNFKMECNNTFGNGYSSCKIVDLLIG